jgi:outer membrane protein assembly factor BamB
MIAAAAGADDKLFFHQGPDRSGWNNAAGKPLAPDNIRHAGLSELWHSETFPAVQMNGRVFAAVTYSSLLTGKDRLIATTANGDVYALDARSGKTIWHRKVADPVFVPSLDGGRPLAIMASGAIDGKRERLYTTVLDQSGWKLLALNLSDGTTPSGWPVAIERATVEMLNRNPAGGRFQDSLTLSQRAALNLSPDGQVVYVTFGAYDDSGSGWLVAIETGLDGNPPRVASSFVSEPTIEKIAAGGMWAPGGPTVLADGSVLVIVGNGAEDAPERDNFWSASLLKFAAGLPLTLVGTYSPWDWCQMNRYDVDLAGAPATFTAQTPTGPRRLVIITSKQGTGYLLDADQLPGNTTHRPACQQDPALESSLLSPVVRPPFTKPAPRNVFGPYSEDSNNGDLAKSRAMAACFRDANNVWHLFFAGSTKVQVGSTTPVPPSLSRIRVEAGGDHPYLNDELTNAGAIFLNPGAVFVTSNGSADLLVWVVDNNAFRTQGVHSPVLYVFDGETLELLWKSGGSGVISGGAKYIEALVSDGMACIATDRVQCFAPLRRRRSVAH